MKLLRYGPVGQEKPGLLDAAGHVRDLSGILPDLAGAALGPKSLSGLASLDVDALPIVPGPVRLGPCVAGVSKIVGVGLNYADHAAEAGLTVPPEPILFLKASTALAGPYDPITRPKQAQKLDWEVELAIVIGTTASMVDAERALDYVAGYCVINDVSERAFQTERSGQWTKGKSADGFAPLGPWLVTRDEVPDPQALDLFLDVNGVRRQTGNTATMVYGVAYLVSYISQFMRLLPGDVIATGTPPGVGMGFKPPVYLQPGDIVRLGVGCLGIQEQRILDWSVEAHR